MTGKRFGTLLALAAAATALVPTVAFGVGGARSAGSHTVTLKNIAFHPGNLSINRGDSVTWLWRDEEEHNVTSHGFHSRTQTHGSYTVRFTHSGTFAYRCTIHEAEGMRGKIIVH
ncbi:MAG TPA: plastocyanin/azurin family copper-binding protein [Solirubrobacteraceae bacterium]|nr:plastocyanin/azurin family copper-binding protein [Solirubrobacteraceae bacterium]